MIITNTSGIMEMPLNGVDITIGDVIWFSVVLIASIVIAKILSTSVKRSLIDKIPKNELNLLSKVVYYGIIVIGVVIALPKFDLSGLLVAGGIAGIVIGFASQSVVSNLVSGLFLVVEHPIKIGDNINIGDVSGVVEDIHILSTIVKTYDGIYVRIPNETVFTSNLTNYVANVARRFEYTVGIRYADDADKAVRIIKQVIWAHPLALKNPSPSVFVHELGNSSVDIVVRIWAPSKVWYDVKMELLWKIKTAIEAEGIEIPFPQRTVWFATPGPKETRVYTPEETKPIITGGAPGVPNHDE